MSSTAAVDDPAPSSGGNDGQSECNSPSTTPPGPSSLSSTDSCSSPGNSNSSSTQNLAATPTPTPTSSSSTPVSTPQTNGTSSPNPSSDGGTTTTTTTTANGYEAQNGHATEVEEPPSLHASSNGTTVVVSDPSASSGQNYVVSGAQNFQATRGTAGTGGAAAGANVAAANNRRANFQAAARGPAIPPQQAQPGMVPPPPRSLSPSTQQQVPPPPPPPMTHAAGAESPPTGQAATQHVVHVHINPGETFSVRVGDQIQHIQGPATVRMVSNNGPPLPMPMQVPPGHMVQQIVDENGFLQHVILSPQPANMAAPPMTVGYYMDSSSEQGNGTQPQQQQQHVYASPAGGNPVYAPPPVTPPQYAATTYSQQTTHYTVHHHHPPGGGPHIHASGQPAAPGGGGMTPGGHGAAAAGAAPVCVTAPTSTQPHACNNHAHNHSPGTSTSSHIGGPVPDERTSQTKRRLQDKLRSRKNQGYRGGGGGGPDSGGGGELYYHMHNIPVSSRGGRGGVRVNGEVMSRRNDTGTGSSSTSHDGRGGAAPAAAAAAATEDAEEQKNLLHALSQIDVPKVSDLEARSALVKLSAPDCDSVDLYAGDIKYELHISEKRDGKYKSVYSGSANEITLKDLKPATEYHLRVRALYEEVKGEMTDSVSFRTETSVPDTPQTPKLSNRTKTSLILKWNTCADNGEKILQYILEYDVGRGDGKFTELFAGVQRQYKITKLTASTGYRFRLAAVNKNGKSGYCEPVVFYTSGSVPSQPDPPMLSEQFVNKLRISWIRRPNDDEFTLQMDDQATGHGFLTVYNGPDLSHIIKNLRRNTEYKFRLQANNDEGGSKFSDMQKFRTLPDRPSPPAKLQQKGRVHPTHFKVMWDPPKDSGGAEISRYRCEVDDGRGWEATYEGAERECVCEHLTPGQQYRVRVAASSCGGQSDWSDALLVCTLSVPPGPCQMPKLQGKPKSNMMHIKWSYPEYDGGASVTEFEVQLTTPENVSREVYRGRESDCVVAGLLPGRPYLIQVRAHNKAGAGPWSEILEVISGAGVPDPPKSPTVTAVRSPPHTALIQWEEPVNNGAAITDYRLEWQAHCDTNAGGGSDYTQLYFGSSLSYEVRNLQPANNYVFRVQALNTAGAGPYSAPTPYQTAPSVPGPVMSLRASTTATQIHLTWKEPASHGSPIVAYNIDLGEKHLMPVDNVTAADIADLAPETSYKLRVQAVNGIGVGPFSSAIKVTTRSLPPAPPVVECVNVGPNSLKLKWGDGRNPDLVQYCLEMLKDNGSYYPVYHGTGQQHKLAKLSELKAYNFRIFARNEAGNGPYSQVYTFKTTKAPPPAVKAPKVTDITLESAIVEWQPVKQMGSDKMIYVLQLQHLGREHEYKEVYRGEEVRRQLTGLTAKAEYQARVCAIRQPSLPPPQPRVILPLPTPPTADPAPQPGQDGPTTTDPAPIVVTPPTTKGGVTTQTPPPPLEEALTGAFSPGVSWQCLSPVQTVSLSNSSPASGKTLCSSEKKKLSDQQWAIIILVVFAVVAVIIALLVQKIVAYRSGASSSTGTPMGGGAPTEANSSQL